MSAVSCGFKALSVALLQALNKVKALEVLTAKLLVIAQEQQLQEVAQIRGDMVKAGAAGCILW